MNICPHCQCEDDPMGPYSNICPECGYDAREDDDEDGPCDYWYDDPADEDDDE